MNVPRSSIAPARSASPSRSSPRSKPPPAMIAQRLVDVGPDRLRVDAAEIRVALLVDLGDPDPAAGQEARQPAAPGAPHRIDQDAEVGGSERVEIDRRPDEPLVALVGIEPLDQPRRLGVGERAPGDRLGPVGGEPGLDDAEDVCAGGRTARSLDLEPVVDPRVVAGGDHDPGGRAALDHLERAHLRRHGVGRERDGDVLGEQDLRRGRREMLGREPPVVGNHDALRWSRRARPRSSPRHRRSGGRCRR